MSNDNTFGLTSSRGWSVRWEEMTAVESPNGERHTVITIPVWHDETESRATDAEGNRLYKHENSVIRLKHASTGNTLIVLEVHYSTYVAKGTRKRHTEPIPFRVEGTWYTHHFKESISHFMGGYGMTLKRCASICHTTAETVKKVNKERLSLLAGDMRPLHPSRHLAVDEFLIEHGHRYCTIVIDADTGELLYLEKGKRKEQLRHFFKWVGDGFMGGVEAITMDMNTNYSVAVKERYPSIAICYDTFHIIQWFNSQVVESMRRGEAGRLRKEADKSYGKGDKEGGDALMEERRLLFDSRFLLLANDKTLKAKDRLNRQLNREAKEQAEKDGRNPSEVGKRKEDNLERRETILKANENIQCCVRAREDLKEILESSSPDEMRERLTEWVGINSRLGIMQLTRFTKTITTRMEGIVSKATHRISSGIIEGTNAFIKNLRRSAFGYQDFDYFALLIWEQTHKRKGQKRILNGNGTFRKKYTRTSNHNIKRLKQTVYRLDKEKSA
jgi:transposase